MQKLHNARPIKTKIVTLTISNKVINLAKILQSTGDLGLSRKLFSKTGP
jgi:hypothetical protein